MQCLWFLLDMDGNMPYCPWYFYGGLWKTISLFRAIKLKYENSMWPSNFNKSTTYWSNRLRISFVRILWDDWGCCRIEISCPSKLIRYASCIRMKISIHDHFLALQWDIILNPSFPFFFFPKVLSFYPFNILI